MNFERKEIPVLFRKGELVLQHKNVAKSLAQVVIKATKSFT